jgi:hypothetical protein
MQGEVMERRLCFIDDDVDEPLVGTIGRCRLGAWALSYTAHGAQRPRAGTRAKCAPVQTPQDRADSLRAKWRLTASPGSAAAPRKGSIVTRHLVHFYNGAYPVDEACDFIATGLAAGDSCVVMLRAAPQAAVAELLAARRVFATPSVSHAGRYQTLDTDEVLARLMCNGRLDRERAIESFAALLDAPSPGSSGRVRIVGDPAAALLAAGNEADALALEQLVGRLATARSASLFCAYALHDIRREGSTDSMLRLCAEHSAVEFPKKLWIRGFVQNAPPGSDEEAAA